MSDFWHFQLPENMIFWHWGLFWRSHWEGPGWKFWKKFFRKFSKNFESFQKYILGILRPRSRSEIDFLDKNLEKSLKDINPPLVSDRRDMATFDKSHNFTFFWSLRPSESYFYWFWGWSHDYLKEFIEEHQNS